MQLNLFEDNRSVILINLANEFIRSRDLDQAVSAFEQLLSDSPHDRSIVSHLELVRQWRGLISDIGKEPVNLLHLQVAWLRLESLSHPVLRTAVIGIMIDSLSNLPNPEQIYIPPRFHLGHLLIEANRHVDAAECFLKALSTDSLEQGKFKAWRGDALTLAENDDDALECYLSAFLEDPFTIDMCSIKNQKIIDLHTALQISAEEEIDDSVTPAWIPVWGWLHGLFTLPLQIAPEKLPYTSSDFERHIEEESCSVPRIWFEMLIHAERLRIVYRDDCELAAVRRLMRKMNGFMFGCYLNKIGGRSLIAQ